MEPFVAPGSDPFPFADTHIMEERPERASDGLSDTLVTWFQELHLQSPEESHESTVEEPHVPSSILDLYEDLGVSRTHSLEEESDEGNDRGLGSSALWGSKVLLTPPSVPSPYGEFSSKADTEELLGRGAGVHTTASRDSCLSPQSLHTETEGLANVETPRGLSVDLDRNDWNGAGGTRRGGLLDPLQRGVQSLEFRNVGTVDRLMNWREVRRRESVSLFEQHRREALSSSHYPALALGDLRKKNVVIEALRRTISVLEADFRRETVAWQKRTEAEKSELAQRSVEALLQQEKVFQCELAKVTEAHLKRVAVTAERVRSAEAAAKSAGAKVKELSVLLDSAKAAHSTALVSVGKLQTEKSMLEGKLRQTEWEMGKLRSCLLPVGSLRGRRT